MLDHEACYQALTTRDERFDGRVFVGITTTGIYCRPVCPAPPAKRQHCRFFLSAAAAQQAGFRPCLRCRPETAPAAGPWRGTSNTISRGLALIAEGALDDADIEAFAERLGVGARQLRRLFKQHLGASPIAVAQTHRVLLAKQLLHETQLPMAEVALAAGFGSVRRFNETFQRLYGRPPSAIRRATRTAPEGAGVTVHLRYRPPYDWPAMLAHFEARAVDGVEAVSDGRYRRVVRHEDEVGTVEIAHLERLQSLAATIRVPSVRALPAVIARIRRMFDLGADVAPITDHLARDPLLRALVRGRPGLRVPGGWDGFEVGVRAILGQQISVERARRLLGQLVRLCGARGQGELEVPFPTPAEVARADLSALGVPGARRRAVVALAEAAIADPTLFDPGETLDETVERLRAIAGIGDWTAHYVALRAAREPDAFPAADAGLLRGAANGGARPRPADLRARSERWRPWRAYAAQHLWTADGARPPQPRKAS